MIRVKRAKKKLGFFTYREYNYLLGKIGANLNQIAKRINETRSIYQADMDEVKGEMEKLWKVQNLC